MPQPRPEQMHTDKFLSNMSVMFRQEASAFVATQVFPLVPVAKQSDLYPVFPKGFFWRDEVQIRPLGGEPARIGYDVNTDSYRCEEYAISHPIDDRVRANTDDPLNPDRHAVQLLVQQGLIHLEKSWQSSFFTTSVWGTDRVGDPTPTGTQFLHFDATGGDPIGVVRNDANVMLAATGRKPNVLVMGIDVFTHLVVSNADILDRIRYTQTGMADSQIIASMFDVERLIVPQSIENSAVEGAADSIGFIFDSKSMLLAHSAPSPGVEVPSAGYTFAWTGLIPGERNAAEGVIQRMRLEQNFSDLIVLRQAYGQKVVASELGIFYTACIA